MTELGEEHAPNGCTGESTKDPYIEEAVSNFFSHPLSQQMLRVCIAMQSDIETLIEKEKDYGDSWKKRGGVGAYMMLARKWDRIENTVKSQEHSYDVFRAMMEDRRDDGLLDDIRDLRRYLLLVESEVLNLDE
jgi:hypothetical protein